MITLQQDAADKLKVQIEEETLMVEMRLYFGWRKVSLERFKKLGTRDHDKFIAHLAKNRVKKIDADKIIADMQDMSVSDICSIMVKLQEGFETIQANTFVERARKYFHDNPEVKYIDVCGMANCSNDGMYFDVDHYVADDSGEVVDNILDYIAKEIFGMYEGMGEESYTVRFYRDFTSFEDHILDPEDDNEEDD